MRRAPEDEAPLGDHAPCDDLCRPGQRRQHATEDDERCAEAERGEQDRDERGHRRQQVEAEQRAQQGAFRRHARDELTTVVVGQGVVGSVALRAVRPPQQQTTHVARLGERQEAHDEARLVAAGEVDPHLGESDHPREQRLRDVDGLDPLERGPARAPREDAAVDAQLLVVDDEASEPPRHESGELADHEPAPDDGQHRDPPGHTLPAVALEERGAEADDGRARPQPALDHTGQRMRAAPDPQLGRGGGGSARLRPRHRAPARGR